MKFSGTVIIASAIVVLLVFMPTSEAAVQCSDVVKNLRPCLSYLQNGSGKPPAACCTGANNLNSAATTSADKQAICNCIKTATQKIKGNDAVAKALPGNCGISLPVPISRTIDCSKYDSLLH
ncbi:non-specific lipid-transfer protein 8 [Cinnamomum micranthum f. kanehirae]|uniref:Non-specific lipid-transfer protein n=1 Tax=Cinnamomum micranthum f. kanehirae TaxID=337451 RepID=A0A3S3PVR9_9MAGN|nr:non-specific lipid-transfer protein 8 [Cinnamomum micranthum f. kanehirae]